MNTYVDLVMNETNDEGFRSMTKGDEYEDVANHYFPTTYSQGSIDYGPITATPDVSDRFEVREIKFSYNKLVIDDWFALYYPREHDFINPAANRKT